MAFLPSFANSHNSFENLKKDISFNRLAAKILLFSSNFVGSIFRAFFDCMVYSYIHIELYLFVPLKIVNLKYKNIGKTFFLIEVCQKTRFLYGNFSFSQWVSFLAMGQSSSLTHPEVTLGNFIFL